MKLRRREIRWSRHRRLCRRRSGDSIVREV